MVDVFEFDDVWKAGYEQAVIEDTKKLELALHVVSFLVKENRRLVGLLEDKKAKEVSVYERNSR